MRPRRRFAIVSLRWGRRCCALEEDHGRKADAMWPETDRLLSVQRTVSRLSVPASLLRIGRCYYVQPANLERPRSFTFVIKTT